MLQILQVIFISLKLAEIGVLKDCSWWIVFIPTCIFISLSILERIMESEEEKKLRELMERLK